MEDLRAALERHDAAVKTMSRHSISQIEADEAAEAFSALETACRALGWDGGVQFGFAREVPTTFALRHLLAAEREEIERLRAEIAEHNAVRVEYAEAIVIRNCDITELRAENERLRARCARLDSMINKDGD